VQCGMLYVDQWSSLLGRRVCLRYYFRKLCILLVCVVELYHSARCKKHIITTIWCCKMCQVLLHGAVRCAKYCYMVL